MWKARQHISGDDLWSMAGVYVEEIEDDSHVFNKNTKRTLPTFKLSELQIGHILGKGGFSVINEINCINLLEEETQLELEEETPLNLEKDTPLNTDFIEILLEGNAEVGNLEVEMVLKNTTPDDQTSTTSGMSGSSSSLTSRRNVLDDRRKYVIKRLRKDLSSKESAKGVIDLSIEMKFLSAISHENIIELFGIAEGNPISKDFFLVMDRLYMTLAEKLLYWERKVRRSMGCYSLGQCGTDQKTLMYQRVSVLHKLSSAFEYLHKKKIVYRDMKPDNIGFDINGVVKIFDFGLCKELRPKDLVSSSPSEQLYSLTPLTGSLEQMAPEVFLSKPYNLRADVYSFGMLLYRIFVLKRPFSFLNRLEFAEVAAEGRRPKLPGNLHKKIRKLIVRCWASQISHRPDFTFIEPELFELSKLLENSYGDKIHYQYGQGIYV